MAASPSSLCLLLISWVSVTSIQAFLGVYLLTVPPEMTSAPTLLPYSSPSSAVYGPWHPLFQGHFSPHHAQPFWWSGCTFSASSPRAWLRTLFSILLPPTGRGNFISQSHIPVTYYKLPPYGWSIGAAQRGHSGPAAWWQWQTLGRDSPINWVLAFNREQYTMANWFFPERRSSTPVMSSYLAFVGTVCKTLISCFCRMGYRCVPFSWSGQLCFIVALNWRWSGPIHGPIEHLVIILFASIYITRNYKQLQCHRWSPQFTNHHSTC
jgi:hypothetical protein